MACEAKDADDGQPLFCDADGSPIETGLTAKKLNGWVPERQCRNLRDGVGVVALLV